MNRPVEIIKNNIHGYYKINYYLNNYTLSSVIVVFMVYFCKKIGIQRQTITYRLFNL